LVLLILITSPHSKTHLFVHLFISHLSIFWMIAWEIILIVLYFIFLILLHWLSIETNGSTISIEITSCDLQLGNNILIFQPSLYNWETIPSFQISVELVFLLNQLHLCYFLWFSYILSTTVKNVKLISYEYAFIQS